MVDESAIEYLLKKLNSVNLPRDEIIKVVLHMKDTFGFASDSEARDAVIKYLDTIQSDLDLSGSLIVEQD